MSLCSLFQTLKFVKLFKIKIQFKVLNVTLILDFGIYVGCALITVCKLRCCDQSGPVLALHLF